MDHISDIGNKTYDRLTATAHRTITSQDFTDSTRAENQHGLRDTTNKI